MTKKQIFLNIFLLIIIILIIYINWLFWLFQFILALFVYSIVFYIFYIIWKKFRKKDTQNYIKYLPYFLEKVSGSLLLLILLLWGFSYYQNGINPSKMPVYYLTNWKKEVIFHWMSHIWTQNFYDNVRKSIKKNKNDWYVLFFEWVRPWTKDNLDKFDKAIWIKFKDNLYESFSKLYWLVNQNNSDFLLQVNNLDFNIDLSIDEIVGYYEDKTNNSTKIENTEKQNNDPIDIWNQVSTILSSLNEKELKILVYINQWIINFIIKNDKFRDFITDNFWDKNLFDVILDKRNEVIVGAITESEYNKIIITYWLMHFKWVFEELKANDQSWKIKKIEYLYPIKWD